MCLRASLPHGHGGLLVHSLAKETINSLSFLLFPLPFFPRLLFVLHVPFVVRALDTATCDQPYYNCPLNSSNYSSIDVLCFISFFAFLWSVVQVCLRWELRSDITFFRVYTDYEQFSLIAFPIYIGTQRESNPICVAARARPYQSIHYAVIKLIKNYNYSIMPRYVCVYRSCRNDGALSKL